MKQLIKKNKLLFYTLLYSVFYMVMFWLLEHRNGVRVHILAADIDYKIPFCEFFIVPYFLWFGFVFCTVIYFLFFCKDKIPCINFLTSLGIGMTVFLLISLVFPNGQNLRPFYYSRDNIFVDMVKFLYSIDTSTNIFPSIHVFNSIATSVALSNYQGFKHHKLISYGAWGLAILIVLATMFLKQHTIYDVIGALILNIFCYYIVYRPGMSLGHIKAGRKVSLTE